MHNSSAVSRLETQLHSLHLTAENGQLLVAQTMATQNQQVERLFLEVLKLQKRNDARLQALEKGALQQAVELSPAKAVITYPQQGRRPSPSTPGPGQVAVASFFQSHDSFSSLRMRFLRR